MTPQSKRLRPRVDVRVLVLDPEDNLVPGAKIVLGTGQDRMLDVTTTDGNGAFYLRSVEELPLRAFGTWRKRGRALQRHSFRFWQEHPMVVDHRFTPGQWELELELAGGEVQRFPFVVTPEPSDMPIEVRVR